MTSAERRSRRARRVAILVPPPATCGAAPPRPPPGRSRHTGHCPARRRAAFTKEQLEQWWPRSRSIRTGSSTQTFMAATYPLQIVEAARFMEQNPDLKGDPLNAKLKEYDWDEAVKSICTFPEVLKKMNDNLDWTQDLGDAMLGQQTELLDAVQVMRNKAYDGGKIESNDQVNVTVEQPDPAEPQIIVIESKDPEVVYVPTYAPATMYPGWGYPRYYYPGMYPYYPPGAGFWGFTAGVIVGGAIWGNCNWGWGGSDVNIDIDRNNNFNRNTNINAQPRQRRESRSAATQSWQHNAAAPQGRELPRRRDRGEVRRSRGRAPGCRAPRRAVDRDRERPRHAPAGSGGTRQRADAETGGREPARSAAPHRGRVAPARGRVHAPGRSAVRASRGIAGIRGSWQPRRRCGAVRRAARARARAARRARGRAPAVRRAGRRAPTAARAARARLAPRAAAARTAAAVA